jgi:uncharacterized protein (TIGR04255 family)
VDVLEDLDYPNPPVVEVALSVQFDRLSALDAARIGLYWSTVRGRFPHAEQHPPLPPVAETFGVPESLARALRIELTEAVPTPRFWLLSEDGSQLVQIQDDRFSHNWRKNVDPYPHFELVRGVFIEELKAFGAFLTSERIGQMVPNQCEVTYINHIAVPDGSNQADLRQLLTPWSNDYNSPPSARPEDAFLHLRYTIPGESEVQLGRLHIDVQPAFQQDGARPIWVLSLTARGRPITADVDGVIAFLNLGREHILKTFIAITSPAMQSKWETP